MAANEQLIITYEDPVDHRIRKYTTAYTEDMAREMLVKCIERWGKTSKCRIIPARELTA